MRLTPETPHSSRRRISRSTRANYSQTSWFVDYAVALGLVLALVLALLSEMPWLSRLTRAHILQGLIVGFLVLLGVAGPYCENLGRAVRRGPNPWLVALLGWCLFRTVFAPFHTFAITELLRMLFCAGVYFAAAYGLRADALHPVVFTVLCLGAGVAVLSAVQVGLGADAGMSGANGVFGNHEQFGSFIAILLPVALALALDRSGDPRVLLSAQGLSILLGAGLLLSLTRSAWFGELVGLLTLAALVLRFTTGRLTRAYRFLIVGPLLVLSLGFSLLVFSDQLAPLLSHRSATFARIIQDDSFSDRLHRWKSACRMAYARPLTGWGLGSFPVIQRRWTGGGDPPAQVVAHGTSHTNLAHNFWVQWAAETGGVGLTLYVGMITAFLLSTGAFLKTMAPGFRRTLLIGCLAATAAACGDMAGAPSYTYPGVSTFAWLWMGLGVAACRTEGAGARNDAPALPPTPRGVWFGAAVAGLAATGIVLAVGAR